MRTRVIPVLIFLAVFLSFLNAAAQQKPANFTDASGKKQGAWCKVDSAGHKIYEGQFRDNIPYDTFRYYYPDGKIKTLSVFSDNGRKVRSVSYFKNGKVMAKGNYLGEKKDSTWQFFSEYDGVKVSEEKYRNGLKEGVSTIFFPEGGVSETITWTNDLRNGLWETWYTDGKIKMKGAYKNGDKSGSFIFYYNSGKVMITGDYLEGHQHGTWLYFSDKGEVIRTETYDKGILLDKTPKE